MLTSLEFVGSQVLILLIIMCIGFAAAKLRLLTEAGIKSITELMLYIVTPCMLINAFQRQFDMALLRGFLITIVASALIFAIEIVIASLIIKDKDDARRRVLQFAMVFSNCGYMALPLLQALMGSEAVLYGAAYNAVYTVYVWTYGVYLMGGGSEKISLRKALVNPGIIGVTIGLILFFCSVTLPKLIAQPIEYMASLNTPLPMLIIGFYLSSIDFRKVLSTWNERLMMLMRLVVVPLAALGIMYLCGVRGVPLVATVVCTSAPIASTTTMFATKYDREPILASSCVAVSTLISVVTMTLIVSFAMFIGG